MKYALTLVSLVPLLANAASPEASVDFSKAYIVPNTPAPTEIRIGGVETHNGKDTLVHSIVLGFNSPDTSFKILAATPQTSSAELLEQQLRGTIWKGDYRTNTNLYRTELQLLTVENSFVGGQVTHTTADPESPVFLRAEVAGNIVTQYLIDAVGTGELTWVDSDQIDYKKLPANTIIPPDDAARIRQLLRLKRTRALEFKNSTIGWGSNSEYRLVLVNTELTGSVGTPPDRYTGSDVMTGNGEIVLKQELPAPVEALPE
ncbi:MAG: hypothetical protein BWK79_06835 [Beggiatoa sp. IS2]|nr:MAG: hypothetical protein BWK79_06835 [Beggiatoa sp. IS2]